MTEDEGCCLYLAKMGNMVKVGITNDPHRRFATLQTGLPEPLECRYLVFTPSRARALELEKKVHRRLASRRAMGEWFRIDDEDAVVAIQRAVWGRRKSEALTFASPDEFFAYLEADHPGITQRAYAEADAALAAKAAKRRPKLPEVVL